MPAMTDLAKIVLASASPRRRRLLEEARIPFDVVPADVDETRLPGETPAEFAARAAADKGMSVAARLAGEGRRPWIVAADTVVVLDAEILNKPRDPDDAASMLRRLAGRTHHVLTAFVVGRMDERWHAETCATRVRFHELSDEEIAAYVATGEGADKAGAYAIQEIGAFLVDRIDGDYFNVVGLPVSRVIRTLLAAGAVAAYPPR
jgi:septum formation protein